VRSAADKGMETEKIRRKLINITEIFLFIMGNLQWL